MKLGAFSSLLATLALVCSSVVDAKYTKATRDNFKSLVTDAKTPVAVMFCAGWSGFCPISLSSVDKAVGRHSPMTMVYVNIDENPELLDKYNVHSIPTFKGVYKNKVVNSYSGPMLQDQANKVVGEFAAKS